MTLELKNPVPVQKHRLRSSGNTFARAFQDDLFVCFAFPDSEQRKLKSPHYWRLPLQYAWLYGEGRATSSGLEGVVAWLSSDKIDLSLWRTIRSGNHKLPYLIGFSAFKRISICVNCVMSIQQRVATYRHVYLNALCASPEHQGKGFSTTCWSRCWPGWT